MTQPSDPNCFLRDDGFVDRQLLHLPFKGGCSNNKDLGEKQIGGGGTERVTGESVDGFIESKGTSSTNEYSEDKEMEQSGTIDSFDKSSDCSSSKEKPNDLDTGVDGKN
ncbi:hypothetical protein ElyMa_006744900 [Elysia marginata]|uniref:CTNNB1 binding N-teminal domain-containing protein n=1 Tax=Elysia marginata TaxID=1093978 RepID=A0AAV4IXN7_9GAST|nr:hypothetical protein ElyMa_006744900 [Elysia marginata]